MRTSRLTGQVIVALGLLVAPLSADAQSAERVYRIGYLGYGQMRPEGVHFFQALRAGLREHGYVEGRNLALEFRSSEGKVERFPALAAELVGLPVDVIL